MDALAAELLHLPEDYDSDAAADELPAAQQPFPNKIGERTCAQLFKNAVENRTNSKRALRDHVPTAMAPSTERNQTAWFKIFRAFLKTLGLPDDTVPTGSHLYRFVDSVSRTIKSRYRAKEAPSVKTIQKGLSCLANVLIEVYDDFKLSNSYAKKIDSLLIKLVKDKVLTAGKWRPSNHVGFRTVLALTNAWMQNGLTEGVASWDTFLSRQLSIVLISSLACRSGEILRSNGYKDMECCLFKDLTLFFEGGDDMEHLIMNVDLRFVKGFKALPGQDRHVRIDILSDPAFNSACPIKLLIIHALRIGAVDGTTWEDIRAKTIARADKTVQWITPDNPVIPAIRVGQFGFLELKTPATIHQAIVTMKRMSIYAKCHSLLLPHDLRRGSTRDIAHLDSTKLRGYANTTVAGAVGHSMASFMRNVTDNYVGGSDVSVWTARAESDWRDSRRPEMGSTAFVKRPLYDGEFQQYCRSMGWDPSNAAAIVNARLHLLEAQQAEWRASLKHEPARVDLEAAPRPVLQPLGGKSSRGINANVTHKQATTNNLTAKDPVAIPIDPQILGPTPAYSKSAGPISAIPEFSPDVTDDDPSEDTYNPDTMPLSEEEYEDAVRLLEVAMTRIDVVDATTDEDAEMTLMEALDDAFQHFDETDPIHSSPTLFIEYFSRINIMRNQKAGRCSEAVFQENIYKWIPTGNSRDWPTCFTYHCINRIWGCEHMGSHRSNVEQHIFNCKISESNPVKPASIMCRKPNCSRGFKTDDARVSHERDHDFERRQCNDCDDGKWFETERSWNQHKTTHTDVWDPAMVCGVPDCPRGDTPFPTRESYRHHLRGGTHNLRGPDVTKYLPALASQASRWGKRKCPFEDCSTEGNRQKMEKHLRKKVKNGGHGLSAEEATTTMKDAMEG